MSGLDGDRPGNWLAIFSNRAGTDVSTSSRGNSTKCPEG
jgi:hypothetical protein